MKQFERLDKILEKIEQNNMELRENLKVLREALEVTKGLNRKYDEHSKT